MTLPLRAGDLGTATWSRRLYSLHSRTHFPAALEADALRTVLLGVAEGLASGIAGDPLEPDSTDLPVHLAPPRATECLRLLEHRFEPQGVSLVLFGPRLRAVLHTWPEQGRATLDVVALDEALAAELVRRLAAQLPLSLHAE